MKTLEECSCERGRKLLILMLCEFFPGLLDESEPVEAEDLVVFLREVIRLEAAR